MVIAWEVFKLPDRFDGNIREMATMGVMETRHAIKTRLRSAVEELRARCLQKATAWTLEQIVGIEVPATGRSTPRVNVYAEMDDDLADKLMLARSFLESGEYQRCAYFLQYNNFEQPTARPCNDHNLRLFLLSYARYMAGEKLKNQLSLEIPPIATEAETDAQGGSSGKQKNKSKDGTNSDTGSGAKNSNLQSIYHDLLSVYRQGTMDGFLLYLFAVVVRDLHRHQGVRIEEVLHAMKVGEGMDLSGGSSGGADGASSGVLSARQLFIEAIQAYPWNWSCWLELAELCVAEKQALPTWQEITSIETSCHPHNSSTGSSGAGAELEEAKVMYACFLVHAYLEKHCGDLAMQVLQAAVLPVMPSSLIVQTQVGLAQYTLRQYDAAEGSFEQVRARDPYRLASLDTYSNILYVKEKHADLAKLAHAVVEVEKFCPESCCVVGNHYSLKGKHERAVLYFQRAIKLNSRYLSAWTLMGHEYMELRNTAAAVQCYRNAVAISEVDYRAWYGLGQTYEMLHLYQYAHFYYRKAAYLRPLDARMWGAVGNCLLKLGLRDQAILSFERAVGCGDLEGIATRDLARLCREEGQTARAAQFYFRFLQIGSFFHDPSAAAEDTPHAPAVHSEGADLQRTAPRRANSGDIQQGSTGSGSGSAALLHAVLNTTTMGGGLDNNNTSTYISKAVSALISQQVQGQVPGGEGSGGGAVDGEQAEALLYLAQYHRSINAMQLATLFCTRLQNYMGAEGDEARALLRSLQASVPLPHAFPGTTARATGTGAAGGRGVFGLNTSALSTGTAGSAGASGGRRTRANLSNVSAFTRSSTRRQSTGYAPHSSGNSSTPADFSFSEQLRGRAGECTPPARSAGRYASPDEFVEMTPSQTLQMEYTALSLSPASSVADSAPPPQQQQRQTRRN